MNFFFWLALLLRARTLGVQTTFSFAFQRADLATKAENGLGRLQHFTSGLSAAIADFGRALCLQCRAIVGP